MTLRHAWLFALALSAAAAGPAAAQGFGPPPGGAPGAPGAEQVPECAKPFIAVRQEVEKHGKALQSLQKSGRKPTPQQACDLLSKYVEADAKAIAIAEKEGTWCGFAPQLVKAMKDSHGKAAATRKQACQVAASGGGGPAAAPRGPSFSEALGTTRVPDANSVRSGPGTFNTMTGNALKR
jgi:hypothetical protein